MQERCAIESDIDEGRLHARQYPGDSPQANVADQAARSGALEMKFLNRALLDQGDPDLEGRHVHENVFSHVGRGRGLRAAAVARFRGGASP